MDFEFLVPEDARLPARISQRSNLKYVHRVLEQFEERQRQQFRESCLGFLADVPDIQFSAQLIQQMVFRTIRTEKRQELWFNLQGHLSRFGLQEYALVTGLRCGVPPDDDHFRSVLGKTRLQDKYFKSVERISCAQLEKVFLRQTTPRGDRYKLGLVLIVEGVFNAPEHNVGLDARVLSIVNDLDLFFAYPWGRVGYTRLLKGWRGEWVRKFRDAKRKKEKKISYTILGFPIALQIWAFEVVPEIGAQFGQRVGDRSPRLLNWTATKQTQQRTYDSFFKKVKLHVYATMRPSDVERQLPYISTLIPFDDHAEPSLDELARTAVGPQFDADAELGTGNNQQNSQDSEEDESSSDAESDGADDRDGTSDSDHDEDGSERSGDGDDSHSTSASDHPREHRPIAFSAAYTPGTDNGPSTSRPREANSAPTLSAGDVQGLLLDQRILFEMRLRTVKLELMEHVTTEFNRLRTLQLQLSDHVTAEFVILREYISTLVAPVVPRTAAARSPDPIQPGGSPDVPRGDFGQDIGHSPLIHDHDEASRDTHVDANEIGHNDDQIDVPSGQNDDVDAVASGQKDDHVAGAGRPEDEHAQSIAVQDDITEVSGQLDVRGGAPGRNARPFENSRRRSERIRKPAAATKTPYTRGRGRIP